MGKEIVLVQYAMMAGKAHQPAQALVAITEVLIIGFTKKVQKNKKNDDFINYLIYFTSYEL